MSLVFNEIKTSVPQVHVLIIGAGYYPYLPGGRLAVQHDAPFSKLTQLPLAATSARHIHDTIMQFHNDAAWAKPLGSIEMLLSSKEDLFPGINIAAASLENITNSYTQWQERCNTHKDNIALFYYSGLALEKGDMFLLAEDFGYDPDNIYERAFAFGATRSAFHNCRAQTQLFFADTCRLICPSGFKHELCIPPLDQVTALYPDCKQDLTIKSVATNETDYGKPGETSVFAQALVQALSGQGAKKENGLWTVSTNTIATCINQCTEAIAPSQSHGQRFHIVSSNPVNILSHKNIPGQYIPKWYREKALTHNAAAAGYSLYGEIITSSQRLHGIPKLLEVFDAAYNKHSSQWITNDNFLLHDLHAATYMLRLQLPSGMVLEKRVAILTGSNKITFTLQDEGATGNIKTAWTHLTKNIAQLPHNNTRKSSYSFNCRLWTSEGNERLWTPQNGARQYINLQAEGSVLHFHTEKCTSLLQIFGNGFMQRLLYLPPDSFAEIVIRPSLLPEEACAHPLDISVSTDNWKTEALLTLMMRGAINDARTLVSQQEAEHMLRDKRQSAATAAIAGYFLLRTGESILLHADDELGKRFPWLPDGLVIQAWQMLQHEQRGTYIPQIKALLTDVAMNKMPVYTEGFRLLHEGLSRLSCLFGQGDEEVEAAYSRIKYYNSVIDRSMETTTFDMDNRISNDIFRDEFYPSSILIRK